MDKLLFKRFIVIAAALAAFTQMPARADTAAYQPLSAREFKSMLDRSHDDPDVVLLDVRTPGEFADGHIAGAVNVDYYAHDFVARLRTLDPQKAYLVYCRSGNRSGKSLAIFQRLGFKRVWHLETGIRGWLRERYPLMPGTG